MLPKRIIKRLQELNRRICCIETAADPIATIHSVRVSLCCIGRSWGHYTVVKQEIKRIRHHINCCLVAEAPPYEPTDDNAIEFITRAGLVEPIQIYALDQLLISLKAAGLYGTKLTFIWPFIGGTEAAHSKEVINIGYDNEIHGTWVHSATGSKPVGPVTDATYMRTWFSPFYHAPASSIHLSIYLRDSDPGGTDMGMYSSAYIRIATRVNSSIAEFQMHGPQINFPNTESRGLWTLSRITDSDLKVYHNSGIVGSNTGTYPVTVAGNRLHINGVGVGSSNEESSPREVAFASAGLGLTTAEQATLYTIVQAYQTNLGRQV